MPKFAVYYVPDAADELYRLGSQLLGHDVRARASLQMTSALRDRLPTFEAGWVARAEPYGFHVTLCDAIDCTWEAIAAVERELEALLCCFDPAHQFTLRQRQDPPIGVWGKAGEEIMVLRYQPNDYLLVLATLLVARLNPLGTGSGYLQRHLTAQSELAPPRVQRTRLFYSPWVLDEWAPHFTLVNPYSGTDREGLVHALADVFATYSSLTIRSLCLMVQPHEDGRWHIHREVWRPSP